jgi:RHS repeat-associated protein
MLNRWLSFPAHHFVPLLTQWTKRIQRKDRMYWQIEDAADFKAQFERRHGVAAFEKTGCLTLQSPNPSESSAEEYDGYGRPSRTEVANGQSPSGFYQQDTCYDANGNVAFKSYRYQSTGFGASKVCSGPDGDTFTHDVLGRLLSETRGDGETRTYVYTGRAKEFTDENGVSRISQMDGLGRLTIVCEIAPASINTQNTGTPGSCGTDISGTGLTTTYSYALSTPTRRITQGAQTRTFVSDWLGRSTLVTEPESGTTTYGYAYNSTGLVATRTRPMANQTNASTTTTTTTQYDSLGRVVSINYSDNLTPAKTYTYDIAGSASSWSNFSQANLKGRLSVASGSGAATAFSYDAMGQIAGLGECFPSQCGTPSDNKLLSYFYDLAGGIGTSVDGAGVKTNYGYTAAGEVNLITSSVSNSTHPGTLLSNVQNGPFGPTSFTLGNGVSQINTYDALGRLNGSAICPSGTTASIGCSGEIYGFSTTWQGKQLKGSSDTVEGSGLTYGYDNFSRLVSMTNGSSQPLYTYTYDRYGNRWTETPGSGIASGSGSSFNPTYIAGTNQITGMGYIYDAAGNLMTDGTNTYTYDADGNLLKQVNSSVTLQYTYNALNQQVVQSLPALSRPVTTNQVFDRSGNLDSLWLVGSGQIMGRANWGSKAIETYEVSSNMAFFDHRDWVGTRRAITNATGTVTDVRESLPFGDDAANVSGGQDNTFDGFTGLWNGATNNTNHAQFREYLNIAGRFLQPDPYSGSYRLGNPQSFNRYAYVLNNPLSLVDPLGLDLLVLCGTYTENGQTTPYYCAVSDGTFSGGGGADSGFEDAIGPNLPCTGPKLGGCTNAFPIVTNSAPSNGQSYSFFKQWLKDVKSCFVDTGLGTIANQMDPFSPSASNAVQGAVDSASQSALAGAAAYSVGRGLTVPLRSGVVRAGVGASEALGEASGWITIANLYVGIAKAYQAEWQQCGW